MVAEGARSRRGEDGEPVCHGEGCLPAGTRKTSGPVSEVKGSVKAKQKNMLARASPAPLHLKMQAREQQQQQQRSGSSEEAPAARNNSEHCQHEGHSPFSKNGSLSPMVNNSVNGIPGFSRADETHSHLGGEGKEEFDHTEPPRPPVAAGPGGQEGTADPEQPLAAELARLDLNRSPGRVEEDSHGIRYVRYESELQMPWIMRLITKDLSEPYSIYTYRYFIHNWPQLCFLAMVEQECVGAIVCKLDMHKKMFRRGYIAMLAVDSKHRRKSIGTNLVKKAIYAMVEGDCDEVVLETEITNKSALKLYENLGFVRDKRLFRYYLNGVDALRLKLWLR
ncbi:unnamed protein product [Pleuronectes platessa]|uniref:N-alpha-acetyltransferase 30 n=1 Tax=Pleuronectes platessa TaxID=8262 RepID=A0A9N7TQ67_PLEPL|nr:unnamed protein product [Pleuronectes platessa]